MFKLNIKTVLISALVIACVGLIAYSIFNSIEYYEEEQDTGYQAEAANNPFLAAQKYLQVQGVTVDETTEPFTAEALENYGTLFVSGSSNVISPRQLNDLIDWIDRGGILLIRADINDSSSKDFFLDYLQLTSSYEKPDASDLDTEKEKENCLDQNTEDALDHPVEKSLEEDLANRPENGSDDQADDCGQQALTALAFNLSDNDEQATLQLNFNPHFGLDHPDIYEDIDENENTDSNEGNTPAWILNYHSESGEHGIHFMQFDLGNGLINVLSDDYIWHNDNIASHDHAYFLSMLVNDQSPILFMRRIALPPLSELFALYAREAFIAGFILLLLWVARNIQRMGKIIHYSNTSRRSLAEHIAASGQYLWNGNWQQNLVAPLRDEIHRKARLSIAHYQQAEAKQQLHFLSDHSGLAHDIVKYAMTANIKHSEDDFFNTVQCLQKIRESL
ncbi:MAG: hypothetical protein COA42_08200 [Alteromonadaceae bacterium]|nr:MAG: hypothetical protein COA42_08200 [Alteromonadaceae bacterium]